MMQLENMEAIETRLWRAADLMRSRSELASSQYVMPVMGLIFLRHAYSRFLAVKPEIVAKLPSRGGMTRSLTKEDFSQKGSIFLRPEAQFDYFITKAGDPQLPQIIISATESIGVDYQNLKGVLPKQEYQSIPVELLGDLVRTLNPPQACIAASSCTSDSNGWGQSLVTSRTCSRRTSWCWVSSRAAACRLPSTLPSEGFPTDSPCTHIPGETTACSISIRFLMGRCQVYCLLRDPQISHFGDEGRPLQPKFCGGAIRSTDNPVGLAKGRDDVCPICIRQRAQNPARRFLVG